MLIFSGTFLARRVCFYYKAVTKNGGNSLRLLECFAYLLFLMYLSKEMESSSVYFKRKCSFYIINSKKCLFPNFNEGEKWMRITNIPRHALTKLDLLVYNVESIIYYRIRYSCQCTFLLVFSSRLAKSIISYYCSSPYCRYT